MKSLTYIYAVFMLSWSILANPSWRINPNGLSVINTIMGKHKINIKIETQSVFKHGNKFHGFQKLIMAMQCTGDDPCIITKSIVILIDNKTVYSGLPSYGDLHYVKFKLKKGYIYIILCGGDAMNSFDVIYKIKNGRIVEKDISGGEAPNKPYEITKYYIVTIGP